MLRLRGKQVKQGTKLKYNNQIVIIEVRGLNQDQITIPLSKERSYGS